MTSAGIKAPLATAPQPLRAAVEDLLVAFAAGANTESRRDILGLAWSAARAYQRSLGHAPDADVTETERTFLQNLATADSPALTHAARIASLEALGADGGRAHQDRRRRSRLALY